MNPIQKMKNSPHYLRLKESVEYRFDRKQFVIVASLFGGLFVLLLLMLLPLTGQTDRSDSAITMGLAFLGFLYCPLILYQAYRWLEIFLHIDSYIFREVVLDRPHTAGRYGMYFTVTFLDRHGKPLKRDTAKMFFSQSEPCFEDYNNQKVLIGYNEETDRVVVIKRLAD